MAWWTLRPAAAKPAPPATPTRSFSDGRAGASRLTGGGPIIGLGSAVGFEEQATALNPGDKVVFYTDGLTESQDANRTFFGEERLVELVASLAAEPVEAICDAVFEAVEGHAQGQALPDDLSLLVIEWRGEGRART